MKIKRIHTQVAIMSKDHKFSFDSKQHKLEYVPALSMFKIDETLVPISNIREVLLEDEEIKTHQPTSETIVTNPKIKEGWYSADQPPEPKPRKRAVTNKVFTGVGTQKPTG